MVLSDKPNDLDLDQSNPVPLDPIILRARDELLEEHADKSLEEQITFYKAVIEGEKDSLQRLSAMAARVYIIRKRLALLAGNVTENQLDELSDKQSGFDLDRSLTETSDVMDPKAIGNNNSWMRLRIVDSSEVNGVRFPSGVVIDVKREDGEKLIESGKADFVSTEESRQFKSEEGLDGINKITNTIETEQSNEVPEQSDSDGVKVEEVPEEGAAEEVKVEEVPEEGAAEEVKAEEVPEEGAVEEVKAEEVPEEGAAEEVKAEEVPEEGQDKEKKN